MAIDADVTTLLIEWKDGDEKAKEHLYPMLYRELHRLAERFVRNKRSAEKSRPNGAPGRRRLNCMKR